MTKPCLGRLLIVDDEGELTKALCEMLAEQNFEAVGLSSGKDALKAIEAWLCHDRCSEF